MATSSQRTLKADFIEGILSQKNYIRNSGAKDNTLGYSAYADVASPQPVDATGGSPTVSITRTTSSPLSGDACLLFTKDAADRQGQGFSYDFEIDKADEGKVFSIELDYAVASGTYSGGTPSTDSDLTIYIISKEFGTVIQPSGFKLDGAVVGVVNRASCSFQPPVSAGGGSARQFRLAFHVATTSTSPYTVKLDNISVSPVVSQSVSSPIVAKYYHTTGTTLNSGDIIDFNSKVTDNSASVTTGASWKFTASEAGSFKIDTYIESSSFSATAGDRWALQLYKNGTFYEQAGRNSAEVTASQFRSSAASFEIDLVAGDYIDVRYNSNGVTFPLLGASQYSSITISKIANQSNGLITGGRVSSSYYHTTGTTLSSGDIINFNSKRWDTNASVTTGASWKYTAQEPGEYEIDVGLLSNSFSATAGDRYVLQLFKNGSQVDEQGRRDVEVTGSQIRGIQASFSIELIAGDYIDVRYNSNGMTFPMVGTSGYSVISIKKVSNQAQTGRGEEISARAYTTTAGSYNAGDNIVWDGKSYDTHNAFDIATGKFTAPAPGRYRLKAQIRFQSSSNTQGDLISLLAEKNDTDYAFIDNLLWPFTGSSVIFLQGETTIQMNAGDTCNIYAAGWASGTRTLSTNAGMNYIEIERIG